MFAKQFRVTHNNPNKHHIHISGNQIIRLKTQPKIPSHHHRYVTHSPQVERLSTFRSTKRYDSIDYEGRIRQKITNHESFPHLQQKGSPESKTVRLPKLVVTQSPPKLHSISVKKDFVLNFYKRGKVWASRRKKVLQNAKA